MQLYHESEVFTSIVIKDFGTFRNIIYLKSKFRKSGYEEAGEKEGKKSLDTLNCEQLNSLDFPNCEQLLNENDNILRSLRRSKQKVLAIGNLNKWHYFFTGTFDANKVGDRYALDDLKKTTLRYFKGMYLKYGIKYLIIPELHKDGALHWHGLIYDPNNKLKMSPANCKSNSGREIYNLDNWNKWKGFNTVVRIDNDNDSKRAVSNYITKYISKGQKEKRIFDKYYYCSNGLINNPITSYLDELPKDFFSGEVFENDFCYIKQIKI